jgi:cobalamin biosynthesis protein CobT
MKEKQLADLARTILKDPTVKVTFGGSTSYFTHETDKQGNKIVLINIAKMEATPTGVLLMCGLVFHEIGHKHTTGGKSQGMLGDLENIIEDVRTEQLTIKERPGASFDLEAVVKHYLDKGSLEPKDLNTALMGKTMAYGRAYINNQKVILPLEEACNEMIDDAFGQSFIVEIEAILDGYRSLNSTDDTRAMAKALIDLLIQEQLQQQNQQLQQQQSQSQSQQQQGAGQGNNGGDQDDTQQDAQAQDNQDSANNQSQQNGKGNGDDDPDQQDADGDSSNGEADTQSDPNGENDGDSNTDDSDDISQDSGGTQGSGAGGCGKLPTDEEIAEMLAKQTGYGDFGQLMQDELDELAAMSVADNTIGPETPEWPELGRLTRKYISLDESESMAASSRMRARLGSLLFSSKRLPVTHGTSGRKINTNKLVRMMTAGDPKIFQKKIVEAAPNSAVAVVLDTSGSMDDNGRWVVANKAAFALNSCLHSLNGVKCATVEFSTKDRNDGSYADVNLVCDFGVKPKSDVFNIPPFSGTPTDQAIWVARGMLLQRPEPRKIMLIVTDGEPNNHSLTHGATRRAMKDGIEIAAIGIQSSEVRQFWKNNRVINTLSDLPAAMFGMMEELLTRRPGGTI